MLPESTLEELRRDNHDLIAALDDIKGQKEQPLLLNAADLDVAAPPRAAALLRKGEISRERLAFAIRGAVGRAAR